MSVTYDKYSVTQYSVSSILGYIDAGDIAIPEIQRPFVWKGKQVRDLIDSLYNGYPTGYLIIYDRVYAASFFKDANCIFNAKIEGMGKRNPHQDYYL